MKSQDETARGIQSRPSYVIVVKALVGSAAAVASLIAILHLGSGGNLWPMHASGDAVDSESAKTRAAQFTALTAMPLAAVMPDDKESALDSMKLEPAARVKLVGALPKSPPPESAPANISPESAAATSAKPDSPGLAWVMLWDTDAEDGDVVRLDSAGYTRTVTLAKKPVTFAVPVPRDGIIWVTGVRDGEGGGITVGLGSGASRAVFPIMSTGQRLGLKVSVNP